MTQKKISTTHVDRIGSVVNGLSKVMETVNCIQNSMMDYRFDGYSSGSYSPSTYTLPSTAGNLIGGNPDWRQNSSISISDSFAHIGVQDSGKYPIVDIVSEILTEEDKPLPVYRVDVYAAGVPKENISVHLEEGNFVGTTFYPPKMNIRITKNETKEKTTDSFVLKESKHSYTNRILSLPEDADVFNTSEAILENGVLVFRIRKNAKPKTPTQLVTINIK